MNEKLEQRNIVKTPYKEISFIRIKELQKLPDEVVSAFLNSKGKLSRTDFARRIKV